MSNDSKLQFLTSLLSQEQPLSSATYEEYRTMLTKKLEAAETKARTARRVTVGVWIAVAICGALGGAIGIWGNSHPLPQPVIAAGFVAIVAYNVLFIYGLFRGLWYFAVERRSPQIVKQEIQDALLLELTRKVDALAQRLDGVRPTAS
jgi:hypothetical protein